MRATILFAISFVFCHFSADASIFIFKSGKSVQGAIRYEDASTIRILESSGIEMTLRKSELNAAATTSANKPAESVVTQFVAPAIETRGKSTVPKPKIYTNRDIRTERTLFVPPHPESSQTWKKSLAKLEQEFIRLQGACRGAGTGPNLSKVLRSHTYNVGGKPVHITGYWADPANIEKAKQICERAIQTESELQQARRGFQDFLERQKNQDNSLTAR